MRIARFSHDDVPQYAFVQYDEAEEKDYLVALDGYPLGGSRVNPTGERYALDADGIRLLAPIIPSKRTMRRMRSSCMRPGIRRSPMLPRT